MLILDGVVTEGEMSVNQSSMTGESVPVVKTRGGYVYAGTVVEEGECVIEVTKKAGSGKYDQIVHMIEESEKLKSNTEARAYHLADSLVPYSLGLTAAVYLVTGNVARSAGNARSSGAIILFSRMKNAARQKRKESVWNHCPHSILIYILQLTAG